MYYFYQPATSLPAPPILPNPVYSQRPFPPINTAQLKLSVRSMKKLVAETSLLLNKLADSSAFAYQVMTAAQQSKQKEVERLIKSAGITSKTAITYTPDSLHIELSPADGTAGCCHLIIVLRWQ
ncbi:hypothetical protein [Bacillus xiapuensis]|uniref:hypothetical protein n=1 Tax=Bacillus xiapuensis TaxID=2014075 RepID=UPI000C24EB3E|nr:hypothetical protein [Bacillus xiapuensis]